MDEDIKAVGGPADESDFVAAAIVDSFRTGQSVIRNITPGAVEVEEEFDPSLSLPPEYIPMDSLGQTMTYIVGIAIAAFVVGFVVYLGLHYS
jgi:hypothetical protein